MELQSNNCEWYALYVRERYEKIAASQLSGRGYEVYLPTYQSKRRCICSAGSIFDSACPFLRFPESISLSELERRRLLLTSRNWTQFDSL